MVLGASTNCKVEDLYQVKNKLNQTGYLSIPKHHAIPSRTRLVAQGFLFMQDNNPEHTSKLCQTHIKSKEQYILQLMFILSSSSLWRKERREFLNRESGQSGSFLSVRSLFVSFRFNLYLMWLWKTCI